MNQNTPQSIKDLQSYIDSVPFGTVKFEVKRVDRKTVLIETEGEETLRYVDNNEAIKDLSKLIMDLINTSFTGDAKLKLQMKDGQIQIVSVYSTKETKY